ncbi:MAG: 3'-5' exonuclease [Bacteriovoracaceae bacterium]|nr:3'-5' exonuclease [Bacteriovoracaceae bacterium]
MAKAKDIECAKELLKDITFCVFDLETTGGNQNKDKIIEIGMVRIEKLKITDKKNFLIDPEIKIPEFIQKLTSISQNDVKGKPIIDEKIEEILEFMGDSVLVAHNTSFDIPFFDSVLRRLDRPEMTNKNICTNLMTKYLIPNLMNSNLNYMSRIFGIEHTKAHRAMDDAEATATLLLNYLTIFINKNITKINQLYYPRNRFELDRANFKKAPHYTGKRILTDIEKKLDELSIPYLISLKGENGVILFALVCQNDNGTKQEEREWIKGKLEGLNWKTATIRLFGPFVECLINYNSIFCKLSSEERTSTMEFLWRLHFPMDNPSSIRIDEKGLGDFMVFNHLVPDQYVIYPQMALNQKSRLIFRYPGHKKKLLQFLKSRIHKMNEGKFKQGTFSQELKQFLNHYLLQSRFRKFGIFQFNKALPHSGQEQFLKELEGFLSKTPNDYNYPKEYI